MPTLARVGKPPPVTLTEAIVQVKVGYVYCRVEGSLVAHVACAAV